MPTRIDNDTDRNLCLEVALIRKDIEFIKDKLGGLEKKIDVQFVTRLEFEPVKRIVYGLVGLILTTVIIALVGLVVIR